MKKTIKKNWKMLIAFMLPSLLFFPSLFSFYTNDDFFFLKISNISSLGEFFKFFSLTGGPEGFGMYRPLSTQVFYLLAWKLFALNPLGLHVISFIFLFGIIYLVYKLVIDLGGDRNTATIAAFLYGTSATHFGHMYYLATFQELAMTFFVLLSCLFFFKRKTILSLMFFIFGLMSKETAVVTPAIITIMFLYQRQKNLDLKVSKFVIKMVPYVFVLAVYLSFRFFLYGFATGDTYIWDLSGRKLANTLAWYLAWSLNIPETFIDFVDSGLKINSNLFTYWPNEARRVLTLFSGELFILVLLSLKFLLAENQKLGVKKLNPIWLGLSWFVISLIPVAFLPAHKFTYFLALPMIGISMAVSTLIGKMSTNKVPTALFLIVWIVLSTITVRHSVRTHWITSGSRISSAVFVFFKSQSFNDGKSIHFVDTQEDAPLPWSPTDIVKVALSGKNFFAVFYPDLTERIEYSEKDKGVRVESRQFLGY